MTPARQKENQRQRVVEPQRREQRPQKKHRQHETRHRQLVGQVHQHWWINGFLDCWAFVHPRIHLSTNPFILNLSRAELVEHPRVGLHQADQIFRLEHAERAEVRAGFGEALQLVRAAERRVQAAPAADATNGP